MSNRLNLPDDPRLSLLEVLEFRNAAHLEDIAGSLHHLSEQVPGALDDSTAELTRIADTLGELRDLLKSVIGRGLIDASNGALAHGAYIRCGDGEETFRQERK